MAGDRVPLYVRLPRQQAAKLDRLVASTGRRKQQLVSELLADRLTVGRAEVLEDAKVPEGDVLTLADAASLLRISEQALRARAEARELPGRRFGEEWRFSRTALLAWLGQGEPGADA